MASFNRALVMEPEYAKAWYNRGIALGNLGRHEESLAAYERAVVLKPACCEAWNNRGVALAVLSRDEEALAVLRAGRGLEA